MKILIFGLQGVNKGHLGGLDKVFKIRNRHHRIRRQILRKNKGLYLFYKMKIFILGPLRPLKALKGPQIKFSHILMHRPYRDLQNLKISCLYLFPFSHKVVPQKSVGSGGGGGGSYTDTTFQLVNI